MWGGPGPDPARVRQVPKPREATSRPISLNWRLFRPPHRIRTYIIIVPPVTHSAPAPQPPSKLARARPPLPRLPCARGMGKRKIKPFRDPDYVYTGQGGAGTRDELAARLSSGDEAGPGPSSEVRSECDPRRLQRGLGAGGSDVLFTYEVQQPPSPSEQQPAFGNAGSDVWCTPGGQHTLGSIAKRQQPGGRHTPGGQHARPFLHLGSPSELAAAAAAPSLSGQPPASAAAAAAALP